MRFALTILALVAASMALAQGGMLMHVGKIDNGGVVPPPMCTADGLTDWSNACDIPMGVALGIM